MGKKILVIGNDVQVEALLSQAFSGSDFQLLIISGNGSSVAPSGLIEPDLIIFDSLLPGAPGWRTLRQIRQMSPVPIIVLTDVEDSEVRIKSLDLGADYCLSKPLDLDELRARIGVLLRRAPHTAGSAASLPAT
jgi:DNA-binding response OmpR family regulator